MTDLTNLEAEAALLGALLTENGAIPQVAAIVAAEDFHEPLHQRIYAAILRRNHKGEAVNPALLYPEFRGDEAIKDLGGVNYLAKLTECPAAVLALREYAEQVHDLAARRRLSERLKATLDAVADVQTDFADVANAVQAVVDSEQGDKSHLLPFEWAGDASPVLDGAWLIDDFLPRSGPGVVYGHPGSGKSFFALHVAAHVAEGRQWAGRHVERGLVLYLAAEGQSGFRNRLSAMIEAGQLSRTAPFVFIPVAIDLQAPGGTDVGRLIATLHHIARSKGPPALIVVDTLSKTFGAGKENTDDMAAYVANCERLSAEFDCLTLIVHHRPRNGDGGGERGHSSLRGGIVVSILVEGENVRTATTVKQKDGPDGERVSFRLKPITVGTNSRGKDVTTCLVEMVDDGEALPSSPTDARRRKLTGHAKTALRAIEELIAIHGQPPPDTIPREVLDPSKVWRVIGGGQVADKLKSELLSVVGGKPDKKADTVERTARRAMASLKTAEILGSWEEWVWIA